ncbi:MAG: DNA topoisomerase III, partial [Oscillospiraceae bacterium]|nr:DNA topoisomerase III [Oscillospiraceae bacterium]
GKYGFYCVRKCGMNLAKVYGKALTEAQLGKLLSGKQISYTIGGKKTIVLPEIVQNDYRGKKYYQWKVQRK